MDDANHEGAEQPRATGRCECGGVRYQVSGRLRPVVHCHCMPCRRITGHHMAATAARRADLQLESESTLAWYDRTPETRYGFCNRCGATLFWTASDKPSTIAIAGGTLDQPTGLRTMLAIYTDQAADFHSLDAALDSFPLDQPDDHRTWPGSEGGS